ncbi:hypothetical protein [Orlajensenia leifsoniae]|uniref:Uncharacterized protein n=1 Tax=Orlajensenia leifsoniae TaxID=2561933 RepID=A0A4Y9R5B7_9MICO|nr:hypothetical protein [Leifsonia flava]TFV98903.1 hypothetical protein E4M00_05205 [Leifsonia flava]
MTQIDEAVAVWTTESGEPQRIVWRSRRFRVNDVPTALVGPCDWWQPLARHELGYGRAPLQICGWRFQASTDDGETHVFDVEYDGRTRWNLVRVFD